LVLVAALSGDGRGKASNISVADQGVYQMVRVRGSKVLGYLQATGEVEPAVEANRPREVHRLEAVTRNHKVLDRDPGAVQPHHVENARLSEYSQPIPHATAEVHDASRVQTSQSIETISRADS
jgi:hypothetical protein